MRSRIEETPLGMRIVIPSKGNWFLVIFLSVWLCGWAIGEVSVSKVIFFGPAKGGLGMLLFLAFWLTLWTLGGAAVLYTWVWNVAGREIVVVDGARLSLWREPIPLPARKDFDLSGVRNLRVWPVPRWSKNRNYIGVIAFDYGARTVRFGGGLDEAEASMLIDQIQQRFQVVA